MNKSNVAQQTKDANFLPLAQGILQRKCACGNKTVGECTQCAKKKNGLQRKLSIGASSDPLEQEADRIADQVLAMPTSSNISLAPKSIQRFTNHTSDEIGMVPASVDHVIASSGKTMPQDFRQDMEQRFGHDFSQVRVHTGSMAQQSAREINAHAYTAGNNIVFGPGQYSPGTREGKHLLAHELTHVVQQNTGLTNSPAIVHRRRCTSRDDPDAIVDTHSVTPSTGIRAPGDSVQFDVNFNCDVRGFSSDIETSGGTSLSLTTYPSTSSFPRSSYSRDWDGKRNFTNVGTYMVDDGAYHHQLSRVLYAYQYNSSTGTSSNLYASGPGLTSPNTQVATRAGAFSHFTSNHYSVANVETVAKIIRSEMGIGNAAEQRAIAWAVRNQMVRLNTRDATAAQNHFHDASASSATDGSRHLAQEVLSVDMGHDTSGGAIKWFSPQSMPSDGQSCTGFDCGGGLITVTDTSGTNHRKYAPTFHNDMTFVPLAGVRDWFLRLYKL